MILPALSLKQPWASLIAQGKKTIETRVWGTLYRGPLVICSSQEPRDLGPTGQALVVMMLKSCRPMTEADEEAARCKIYDWAVAWQLGKRWPIWPHPVSGQRGLFAALVPEAAFPNPEDLREVAEALVWAKGHGLLKYVRGF